MTRTSTPTIAVFGASGHTGSFVIAELLARGLTPVAVGRSAARLATSSWSAHGVRAVTASIEEPDSLDPAFAGAEAVINCAGPFLDTADAVASAALRAGAHYVDVTAEQASASATFEHFDAPARDAGVVVVPAMGFYGGLADLLLTAATDGAGCDDIDDVVVAIALDSWHPTQGTRLTGRRNTVPRVVIRDSRMVTLPQPAPSTWTFPEPFGRQDVTAIAFSEVPLIVRHLPVANLTTLLNDTPLHDLRDPATPPPEPADDTGRSAQRFVVDIAVRCGPTTIRTRASGRDIYAVTAPLVVSVVEAVTTGDRTVAGAYAPAEVVDARRLLDSLSPAHLQLESDEVPISTSM
jgi:Saccharopine dehydrogenase NADP binding domain